MSTVTRIDDQDNSVVYSQPLLGRDWSTHGGPKEYMKTTHLTRIKGASAKITFSGSSIAVYGTVSVAAHDVSGTMSQYIIDGASAATYTTKPTKDTQYGVEFFQSQTLNPGQHTLEVVNQSEDGWFWLDYFVVNAASPVVTTSQSTSSATLSSTSSLSSTLSSIIPSTTSSLPTSSSTIVPGTSLAPSPTASSADSSTASTHSHGPPAGAIVGAVFGGILALVILIGLIWCIRRKLADRFADSAAAIPTIAPIPSSKSPLPSNQVPVSLPGTPNQDLTQMHHNRYESNASSLSKPYPFSPAGGGGQNPYHAPRLPPAVVPQHQPRYNPSSMTPPARVGTPTSGINYVPVNPGYMQTQQRDTPLGTNPGAPGANMLPRQNGYGYPPANQPSYQPSFECPPAYPGPPPGLSIPTHETGPGKQ